MRKIRDLNVCISLLRDMQRGDDVGQKLKQAADKAIDEIKKIQRKPNLKRQELYKSVRIIAESLVNAFVNSSKSDRDA